ncbi:MAG: sulfite exporter TauE/SafE family protein [bacterium]|nr:sulfite exporter TauE/SafE family protein [bacterium]
MSGTVVSARPNVLRRVATWALPGAITLAWLGYVIGGAQWERVAMHWRSSITMIFGSIVAGSTPQGGGAVAFPVFTKVLQVPADVARTFSLSIQAVGMVTAALIILLAGRKVDGKAILVSGSAGMAGFMAALYVLGRPDTPFWAFRISPVYVKVTFTIALAAMAYIVWLALDEGNYGVEDLPRWNRRMWSGFLISGFAGGIASALTGSGVDVLLFLFIVVLAGLHPRVGVPTSVVAMAFVSSLGFLVLGVFHGQLDVTLAGDQVVAIAGQPIPPGPAAKYDIFGLWLAAIPIVVWGAPLGTYLIHRMRESRLIAFVAGMAAVEVISTAIFLEALRTDRALLTFAIVGLALAISTVWYLNRHRHRILDMEPEALPAATPA